MTKRKGKRVIGLAERRYYSKVGLSIRGFRVLRKLTLVNLAEVLNVNYQQIQRYENGENRISLYKLSQIAEYFETPLEYFINFKSSND